MQLALSLLVLASCCCLAACTATPAHGQPDPMSFYSAEHQAVLRELDQEYVRIKAVSSVPDEQVIAVELLIHRYLPKYDSQFELSLIPKNGSSHVFEVESNATMVFLRGSSGVALASAFNWYLKNICNASMSWSGDQLALPAALPRVPQKVRIVSPFKFNYYMNVCTVSYSAVWWNFSRWEREIDWMAMNGINMPLAFTGQEYVWRQLFLFYGLNDTDLADFFTGPAFLAWGRMGNIRGWAGPLPLDWIYKQRNLQTLILQRMRSFGMTPVLPAFAGHVPAALTRIFPNATISASSNWNNFPSQYCCVNFLEPSDPIFIEIGKRFLQLQNETYGTNHLYNCDQFNELTPSSGDLGYLTSASAAVFQSMTAFDPDAVWVMQGWLFFNEASFWTNDRVKALLDGVPNDHMIILDLFSEVQPVWNRVSSYFGKPFIWNMLHDFGGNVGLYGVMPSINKGPFAALAATGSTMIGIGLTPEGIEQNYMVYEFMAENMWRQAPVELTSWTRSYAVRRYGSNCNAFAENALIVLLNSVYSCANGQYSVTKSMIELRPSLNMHRDGFMPTNLYYDPTLVVSAVDSLLSAVQYSPGLASIATFQFDLVDVTRQMLSNLFITFHDAFSAAYAASDIKTAEFYAANITTLITDLDTLLGTNQHFLLGKWIESAKLWASSPADVSLYNLNARNQITLWGPTGEIADYASKQWSGLLRDYYLPRWQLFTVSVLDAMSKGVSWDSDAFNAKALALEQSWQAGTSVYPVTPSGDPVVIAKALRAKYAFVLEAAVE